MLKSLAGASGASKHVGKYCAVESRALEHMEERLAGASGSSKHVRGGGGGGGEETDERRAGEQQKRIAREQQGIYREKQR